MFEKVTASALLSIVAILAGCASLRGPSGAQVHFGAYDPRKQREVRFGLVGDRPVQGLHRLLVFSLAQGEAAPAQVRVRGLTSASASAWNTD